MLKPVHKNQKMSPPPSAGTSRSRDGGGGSGAGAVNQSFHNKSTSKTTPKSSSSHQDVNKLGTADELNPETKIEMETEESNAVSKTQNSSDKLSSMFQEGKRSTLRVNLIKKSSRQLNLATLVSSRNTQSAVPKREVENNSTNKIATTTLNNRSATINSSNKQAEQTLTKPNSTLNYEEAKKSQKLVVSLIHDISKSVSKEELDEMLKEINSAIGKLSQKDVDDNKDNQAQPTKQGGQKIKRQQQQDSMVVVGNKNNKSLVMNQKTSQKVSNSNRKNTGDTSNSSKLKEVVNSVGDENNANSLEQHQLELVDAISSHSKKEQKNLKTKSSKDNEVINNQRQTIVCSTRRKLELSSDDDVVGVEKEVGNRKPNSSRLPDRCLRITSSHAKYISPHRKRSLEERLSRAQEAREKFLEYRANKFRDILKKVEEMRAWKEEDTMNLKASVQTKLQKADAKRKEQLDKIIRKAHDEDSKVSEIQFINNLEAQNRRHEINSRKKEFEARLQDLQDERQRRFEEKQAKEAAAEERRKTLEAERKAKLLEIQQRRRIKTQKVEQQQQVKENKRIERNRNREQKITAIKEAYQEGVQTLKKRINKKQEQSEHRHEVNLRLIRQKAFELSIKRYNSFISESNVSSQNPVAKSRLDSNQRQQGSNSTTNDSRRLQLKPFNTKKFCNLCKETIISESALFSHLRSEAHHSSINDHYVNTMLTTNEAVEIHNLRHIVDTDEPLDSDQSQQSSRASSLVNYYHSSYLNQPNGVGGLSMSDNDRKSLLAIEKRCRKLRHKLIVAGRPFNRDWFAAKVRSRLAQLLIQQRQARNQTTNTDAASLASTIDLSANNLICQQNKPIYLKMNRITRELISITTDQRISGGGLMPAGIIHTVDRLLADLNKQLASRKVPEMSTQLLYMNQKGGEFDAEQLAMAIKMIEFYAIDTLFLYDIICCLVSILRRIVPNVSLTSKLPSTVASHYSTLLDPVSLNSYYCHRAPTLPPRIYIRMINFIRNLCENHSDLCYIIFQSNNLISLSDILSYRLGFIIGNESPASSISGSSSAATLSAHTIEQKVQRSSGREPTHKVAEKGAASATLKSSKKSPTTINDGGDCCGQKRKIDHQKREKIGHHLQMSHNNHNNHNDKQHEEDNEQDDYDGDDDDDDDVEVDVAVAGGEEEEDDLDDDSVEDVLERAETYKRTEEIVDDMTAGLCKLLATVTETILARPMVLLNQLDKAAFDQRSDDFISYMVSVGIVDTESVIMSHIHHQQHHQHHNQQQKQQQLQNLSATLTSAASATALNGGLGSNQNGIGVDKCCTIGADSSVAGASNGLPNTLAGAPVAAPPQSASIPTSSSKIINFTTSCIQFVTSLVKLVIAKLPDGEEPMASELRNNHNQDHTQLLATLKMSQLSGVLTLVYDMLVHSFNSLHTSAPNGLGAGSRRQDRTQELALALEALKLTNYLAYIDPRLLQETLAADEMLPLQLRHVCSYLLQHLVRSDQFRVLDMAPQEVATSSCGQLEVLKNELMNEIILLLGHFAYLNRDNQLMLKSGRRPTIVEQLIELPFDYFSRQQPKLVLMPTLISCAYLNDQICSLVCQELSLSMLTSFIEDQLLAAQVEGKERESLSLSPLLAHELTNNKLGSSRWRFESRFAKSKWLSAKKYLDCQQARTRLPAQTTNSDLNAANSLDSNPE